MARPPKEGVEYFPLDVDFFQDKKIRLLKAEFGARGLMIVLAAFCRIYSNNGYLLQLWRQWRVFGGRWAGRAARADCAGNTGVCPAFHL